MQQLFQIFAYLKKYHNSEMAFDPIDPTVDEASFELRDGMSSEFGHLQGKEELPPNMPEPRGMGFVVRAKVEGGCRSCRRHDNEEVGDWFPRVPKLCTCVLVLKEADKC